MAVLKEIRIGVRHSWTRTGTKRGRSDNVAGLARKRYRQDASWSLLRNACDHISSSSLHSCTDIPMVHLSALILHLPWRRTNHVLYQRKEEAPEQMSEMVKALFLAVIMSSLLTATSGSRENARVSAEPPKSRDVATLQKAATVLGGWFKQLLVASAAFAETEDKRRFIQKLTDLNIALYDVETKKRYLLRALKRAPLNRDEIQKSADEIRRKVEDLRTAVASVGAAVRAEFKAGGVEAERQLSDAVGFRKEWIEDFQRALGAGQPTDVAGLINEGNAAVAALASAQVELNKIIDKLNSSK